MCYLCPRLKPTDIPKQTCMGDAISEKIARLDEINSQLIAVSIYLSIIMFQTHKQFQNILSLVSIVWDRWSSKQRHPYSSFVMQYIHAPANDPYTWSLKNHLLAFNHTVGHHTREMVGKELVDVICKFKLDNKVLLFHFNILLLIFFFLV